MPSWVIKLLPYVLSIGLVITLLIGVSIWWSNTKADWKQQGYDQAMAEVRIAQEEANIKLRQSKKVNNHETQSLDRPAIIIELCRRGELRTPQYCTK